MTKKGKKTEFQMYESRMAKLEHKLKVAEEARKKKNEKRDHYKATQRAWNGRDEKPGYFQRVEVQREEHNHRA